MNYFPFHVGDYVAATAHLSWDEDMAYTRLIRSYYQTEKPIPKDKAYRLARATTPAQRAAVDSVLDEFFVLEDDGYHQKRCEDEIAKFVDKQNKAKRSANARWKPDSSHSDGNANALETHMRTHSDGNANQEPITNNQEPIKRQDNSTPLPPSKAAAVCVVVKSAGIGSVNPNHPKLLELLDEGAQVQEFEEAARKAVDVGKGFAYALGIVKNAREDARRKPATAPEKLSFAERDRIAGMQRWEQMTNQKHPDLPDEFSRFKTPENVVEMVMDEPPKLSISQ